MVRAARAVRERSEGSGQRVGGRLASGQPAKRLRPRAFPKADTAAWLLSRRGGKRRLLVPAQNRTDWSQVAITGKNQITPTPTACSRMKGATPL